MFHSFTGTSGGGGWEKRREDVKETRNGREGWSKRISASGETESHRLACSFTGSALDNLWLQNGCAHRRTQGLCWATEKAKGGKEGGERWIRTGPMNRGETFWDRTVLSVEWGRRIHTFICEGQNFKQCSIMTTIATSNSTTVLFFQNNEKLNKIDETDH